MMKACEKNSVTPVSEKSVSLKRKQASARAPVQKKAKVSDSKEADDYTQKLFMETLLQRCENKTECCLCYSLATSKAVE